MPVINAEGVKAVFSDGQIQARIDKIDGVEDPKLRVLEYIDFALDLAESGPLHLGEVSLNVSIPGLSNSGVDPESIKDPELKRKYQDKR